MRAQVSKQLAFLLDPLPPRAGAVPGTGGPRPASHLGRMLQDSQLPLLDPPEQLQARAEAVRAQQTQGRAQVSTPQQSLLCRGGKPQGLPPSFASFNSFLLPPKSYPHLPGRALD